jgi:hypothetical protein
LEDNIEVDCREIHLEVVDWILLAQYRDWRSTLVNMVMNLWVPKRWGPSLAEHTISFSRRTLLHGVIYFGRQTGD